MRRLMCAALAAASCSAIGENTPVKQEVSIWQLQAGPDHDGKYGIEGSVFAIGDPVHETLSLEALKRAGIVPPTAGRSNPIVSQILRGVFWNDDPCSLLFSGNPFAPLEASTGLAWFVTFIESRITLGSVGSRAFPKHCPMLGRSHFGDLQFLHGMAATDGESAQTTLTDMFSWARISYQLATGKMAADTPLNLDPDAAHLLRDEATTSAMRLFKSELETNARLRALGSLLHMIQDSYAHGHVLRTFEASVRDAPIRQFLSYVNQDSGKHAHDDAWRQGPTDLARCLAIPGATAALNASVRLLALYRDGASWEQVRQFLATGPFALDKSTKVSGPGTYRSQ